jgi:ribonuclease P protein component
LSFTYPKAEHLKSRKAIEYLFKSGQSFFIYPYKVVYQLIMNNEQLIINNLEDSSNFDNTPLGIINYQLSIINSPILSGFAVSTKNFKHAVDRNRIKRLGREAFRLNKHALTAQLVDSHQQLQVFFIFTDKKLPDYKLIEPKMQACLKKLAWLVRQTP